MSASWEGKVKLSEADARPGRYYVTARNERGQTAYLLGPFVQHGYGKTAHAQALGRLRAAKRYIIDHHMDAFASLSYGTAWMPLYGKAPIGKLNDLV